MKFQLRLVPYLSFYFYVYRLTYSFIKKKPLLSSLNVKLLECFNVYILKQIGKFPLSVSFHSSKNNFYGYQLSTFCGAFCLVYVIWFYLRVLWPLVTWPSVSVKKHGTNCLASNIHRHLNLFCC